MRAAVPTESTGESRVALTPQVVVRIVENRHQVSIESGAGAEAGIADEEFRSAGADVSTTR